MIYALSKAFIYVVQKQRVLLAQSLFKRPELNLLQSSSTVKLSAIAHSGSHMHSCPKSSSITALSINQSAAYTVSMRVLT